MSAFEAVVRGDGDTGSAASQWAEIAIARPQLAVTAHRYLGQVALSFRPGSVTSASIALRQFCWHLLDEHPEVECFAQVARPPRRELQAIPGQTANVGTTRPSNRTRCANGCCSCAASSTGSSSG